MVGDGSSGEFQIARDRIRCPALPLVHKELSLPFYAGMRPDSGDFGSVYYHLDSSSRIVILGSAPCPSAPFWIVKLSFDILDSPFGK